MPSVEILAGYRQRVLQETQFVQLPGAFFLQMKSGNVVPISFPLQAPYVHLQAFTEISGAEKIFVPKSHPSSPELIEVSMILGQYGEELYRCGEVYRALERPEPIEPEQALQCHDRIVIVGASGSGKTSLLHYLARQAAINPDSPLPIFLKLKDYAMFLCSGGTDSLIEFAIAQTAKGEPALYQALQAIENPLWLLDGLDDVLRFRQDIVAQVTRLPGKIVLTSRPIGYHPHGLESFTHFEIPLMTSEKAEKFLSDWFTRLARYTNRNMDWVEKQKQWLKTELSRRPKLQLLLGNPFTLTCLVMVFTDGTKEAFPEHRIALYRACLERIMQVSQTTHSPVGSLQKSSVREAALKAFYEIAWALHRASYEKKNGTECSEERVCVSLSSRLAALDGHDLYDWSRKFLEFWKKTGLIEARDMGNTTYLTFRHALFQEYALALNISKKWRKAPRRTWKGFLSRLHHYAWRESLVMLAGILDEDEYNTLIRRLLRGESPYERALHRDLQLAVTLMGERNEGIDTHLEAQIVRRLSRLSRKPGNERGGVLIFLGLLGHLCIFGVPLIAHLPYSWLLLLAVSFLWTVIWAAASFTYEFPEFLNIFTLPLRLWSRIPERTLVSQLAARTGAARVVPLLSKSLKDPQEEVRRSSAEALGQIVDVDAVPALLERLEDSSAAVRRTAALALGKIGAIPRLVQALNTSNSITRQAAEDALERISRPQAISHLAVMLQNGKDYVRKASARTLRLIGGEQAILPLVQALSDDDMTVRLIAAEALGELAEHEDIQLQLQAGPELLAALSDSEHQVRWAAACALGQIGDVSMVPELIAALKENKDYVKRAISDTLKQIAKTPSSLFLLQVLKDDDKDVRIVTVDALGDIGERETKHFRSQIEPELCHLLHDSDKDVRRHVVEVLGRIGSLETGTLLLELLQDPAWEVRWAAIEAIGNLGAQTSITPLVNMLQDSHGYVRRAAIETLGKVGKAEAVPFLVQALRSDTRYIRHAAEQALKYIGEVHVVPYLLQALRDESSHVRQDAEAALQHIEDVRTVPYLIEALQSDHVEVRRAAVVILGRIGETEVVSALLPLLDDPQEFVRRAVIEALGQIGDMSAVPRLIQTLHDPDETVRKLAIKALGEMRVIDALSPLLELLSDINIPVRRAAIEALGRIGSFDVIPELLDGLQDDNWEVRQSIIHALGRIGDPQVVSHLIEALKDSNGNVRRAAVEALGLLDDLDAVDPLIEVLSDSEWWVRWAVPHALGELGDSHATSALIHALQDKSTNVRWTATEALGKIGNAQAVPYLIPVLKDGNWDVRTAAAHALEQITDIEAIPHLLQAVKSGYDYVYQTASSVLEKIDNPKAIPYLIQGIKEDHGMVREIAAAHLVRLGDAEAVPLLLDAIKHDHWMVRQIAAKVLGQLTHVMTERKWLRQTARALWWRLTDKTEVAKDAFRSLDLVANRLSVLEVDKDK